MLESGVLVEYFVQYLVEEKKCSSFFSSSWLLWLWTDLLLEEENKAVMEGKLNGEEN